LVFHHLPDWIDTHHVSDWQEVNYVPGWLSTIYHGLLSTIFLTVQPFTIFLIGWLSTILSTILPAS
jgi:hypothetical protein